MFSYYNFCPFKFNKINQNGIICFLTAVSPTRGTSMTLGNITVKTVMVPDNTIPDTRKMLN